MNVIEYENGLPKGYLKRRIQTSRLYISSIYLYCLFNLLFKLNISIISDINLYFVINYSLILVSCALLINSIIARRKYKDIEMNNHGEVKAITQKEKALHLAAIILLSVFIIPSMIIYFLIAGFVYLVISRNDLSHKDQASWHNSYH